jgi:hypothetical protein
VSQEFGVTDRRSVFQHNVTQRGQRQSPLCAGVASREVKVWMNAIA